MMSRNLAAAIAVGLIFASGCGPAKLSDNRTLRMDGGEDQILELDPQPKPQKINVDFSSSGVDVSVFLYKEEDLRGKEGTAGANPAKALGKVEKAKEGHFSVEVPPNTATKVIVQSMKKTEVKIKLSN
jgi:hypothetical protein